MNKQIAALALTGAGVAIVAGTVRLATPATAQDTAAVGNNVVTARAQLDRDVSTALPKKEEFPGFGKYHKYDYKPDDKSITTERTIDGMLIRLHLYMYPTAEEAYRAAQSSQGAQHGPMPTGTSTGRKIGVESWRSEYPDGGPPRGSYKLIAVDGRAVVVAYLMAQTVAGPRGVAGPEHVLNPADLKLLEDHTLRTLQRLTDLGYTSQSLVPAPQ